LGGLGSGHGQAEVMGEYALKFWFKALGWIATAVLAVAAIGMFANWNG
jgi:Mn2+/Fe2+ NRAMP family transporter